MTRLDPSPDAGTPGLFVNPNWVPGTAGTFAVIIGASDYPFLSGGSKYRNGESYGLSQLAVSAATAHRFFEWLDNLYDFDAPPAMCWLLLSPTVAELHALHADSATDLGAAPATMQNCDLAIRAWNASMDSLPPVEAKLSRSVFFFSGHGVEMLYGVQVLLPSDYLEPPSPNLNNAISTENLRKGLAASPVPNHFLFLDACRNDVDALRDQQITGRLILNEKITARVNKDALFGMLYAAASGTRTWQPRELELGYSIFGGALIEGLEGASGLELRSCVDGRCEVEFYPLETFVRNRMIQVLARLSPEKVRVLDGGTPPDDHITWITTQATAPGPLVTADQILNARYDVHHPDANLSIAEVIDPRTGHKLFGSERMTDIWGNARAFSLTLGEPVPPGDLLIRSVSHSGDTETYRVVIEVPGDSRGYQLQFTDATDREFAILLAGPGWPSGQQIRYEIEIDLGKPSEEYRPRWITRVEAGLSVDNDDALGAVASIWRTYQAQNVRVAADAIDLLDEYGSAMTLAAPLPAVIMGLILLRARRLDFLHRWWFSFPGVLVEGRMSDGPVLLAERLRVMSSDPDEFRAERRELLLRLRESGLPRLAEVLPMALNQLVELTQTQRDEDLDSLLNWMRQAVRYHRPGGLFAVFDRPHNDTEWRFATYPG